MKIYLIASVFTSYSFCLASLLFAQSQGVNKKTRLELNQKSGTSNIMVAKEKILNPSLNHFVSGFKQVFSRKSNLIYLGTGTAVSLIVWPHDDDISERLKDGNFKEFELQAPAKLGNIFVVSGASIVTHLLWHQTKSMEPFLSLLQLIWVI